MEKYYKAEIEFSKILVNPNNARFYDKITDSEDEKSGMSDIIELNHDHVINLCKDIASFGLSPANNLIVMPLDNGRGYMAYDGNRRLTSLKLISGYKNNLDIFKLTAHEKESIKKLSTNIEKVSCIVSTDLKYVNELLYRIHAPHTGVGQINWSPQSKAKHLKTTLGIISRELSFSSLIKGLDDVPKQILDIIETGKWTAKLRRFTKSDEFMLLLGLEFSPDSNNIVCYFNKDDLKKIIIPFFLSINSTPASKIAQRKAYQQNFICDFIKKHNVSTVLLSNRVYTYYPYTNEFNYTPEQPIPKEKFRENLEKHLLLVHESINKSVLPKSKESIDTPTFPLPNTNSPSAKDNLGTNNTKHTTLSITKRNKKIPPFFSNLKWTAIDSTNSKNLPLILICEELLELSKDKTSGYKKYPIASTILFRSLVEHCFKYFLRKAMPSDYSNISSGGRDPQLQKLINQISNSKSKLFKDSTLSREYSTLFNNDGFKDFLDLATHHARTDISSLEIKSQNFLKIANYILNTNIENIEK